MPWKFWVEHWLLCLFHHDEVMTWKQFPHYWPFVRRINHGAVDSPCKRPITWYFDVVFCFYLIELLNKQSSNQWFEISLWYHYDRWTLHVNASWWLFQKFTMKSGKSLQLLIGQSKEVLKVPISQPITLSVMVKQSLWQPHCFTFFLHIKVVYNKPLTKWFLSLVRGCNPGGGGGHSFIEGGR